MKQKSLKKIENKDPALKYRHSSELLNIQRQIDSLASLGKYSEAKKMKKKLNKLEKVDKSKHEKTIK